MSPERQHKVLLIDDEGNVVRALARTLSDEFAVLTAESGAAGMEIVRKSGPIAVALSDVRMPGMDGFDFVRRLREADPEVVPLLLTGSAEDGAAEELAQQHGVFRVLRKPCPNQVVRAAVQAAVAEHDARRRARAGRDKKE